MQYTFAVCVKCGVQSPPIMNPRNIDRELKAMGWRTDALKFTIMATCPKCHGEPTDAV